MNRKRILFVEQNQDGTTGGSHFSLLYLVRCLDRARYLPIVMFYEKNGLLDAFSAEECAVVLFSKPLGRTFPPPLPILRVPCRMIQKAVNFISVSLIPLVRFFLFVRKNQIDLVHLNNTAHGGWEWLVASKLLRRTCITHERGFSQFSLLAKLWARRFDRILCVSDAVMESLQHQGITGNTVTLHNGIDPADFARRVRRTAEDVRKEFGVDDGAPLIGMVANFQEWKGQQLVIEAIDIVRRILPGLVCLLVGDVSANNENDRAFHERIRGEIRERDLERNIVLTGCRVDVPDLMNAMDIVLHASVQAEPFGRVIVEGMSLKKPVIAANLGGPREIIENGLSGVLVPPGDPLALAEKITFLLKDSRLRQVMGENALKRVEREFSMDSFSHGIHCLYEEIFSN